MQTTESAKRSRRDTAASAHGQASLGRTSVENSCAPVDRVNAIDQIGIAVGHAYIAATPSPSQGITN